MLRHCIALIKQAEVGPDDEAEPLWRAAGEKFEQILRNDQSDSRAWNFWGWSLYQEARSQKDKIRSACLLNSALYKIEIAVKLEPRNITYRNCLGHILRSKAEISEIEDKRTLLADASNHCEKAVHASPDDARLWAFWAEILYLQAECAAEDKSLYFYNEASILFAVVLDITPEDVRSLINASLVFLAQSVFASEDQAVVLLDKAFVLLKRARDLDMNSEELSGALYSNWGYGLLLRSYLATNEEKMHFLEEAMTHCEKAIALEPDLSHGWCNGAAVLLETATRTADENRAKYIASATEMLDKAEAVKEYSSLYCRSALAALNGEKSTCRDLLYLAQEKDTIQSRAFIRRDGRFDTVRDEDWFRELIDSLSR